MLFIDSVLLILLYFPTLKVKHNGHTGLQERDLEADHFFMLWHIFKGGNHKQNEEWANLLWKKCVRKRTSSENYLLKFKIKACSSVIVYCISAFHLTASLCTQTVIHTLLLPFVWNWVQHSPLPTASEGTISYLDLWLVLLQWQLSIRLRLNLSPRLLSSSLPL